MLNHHAKRYVTATVQTLNVNNASIHLMRIRLSAMPSMQRVRVLSGSIL